MATGHKKKSIRIFKFFTQALFFVFRPARSENKAREKRGKDGGRCRHFRTSKIVYEFLPFLPLVCNLESDFILALVTKDSSRDRLWLRVGKAGCRARFTGIKIEI